MKLIIDNGSVVGIADDSYFGPSEYAIAPENFDISRAADYSLQDGKWVITPEAHFAYFQDERFARLAATDWWAIRASEAGGIPMTEDQLAYRQALRTMDDAEDFDPANPVWPMEPIS